MVITFERNIYTWENLLKNQMGYTASSKLPIKRGIQAGVGGAWSRGCDRDWISHLWDPEAHLGIVDWVSYLKIFLPSVWRASGLECWFVIWLSVAPSGTLLLWANPMQFQWAPRLISLAKFASPLPACFAELWALLWSQWGMLRLYPPHQDWPFRKRDGEGVMTWVPTTRVDKHSCSFSCPWRTAMELLCISLLLVASCVGTVQGSPAMNGKKESINLSQPLHILVEENLMVLTPAGLTQMLNETRFLMVLFRECLPLLGNGWWVGWDLPPFFWQPEEF